MTSPGIGFPDWQNSYREPLDPTRVVILANSVGGADASTTLYTFPVNTTAVIAGIEIVMTSSVMFASSGPTVTGVIEVDRGIVDDGTPTRLVSIAFDLDGGGSAEPMSSFAQASLAAPIAIVSGPVANKIVLIGNGSSSTHIRLSYNVVVYLST